MEMYEGNRGKKWKGRIMRGERGRERGGRGQPEAI